MGKKGTVEHTNRWAFAPSGMGRSVVCVYHIDSGLAREVPRLLLQCTPLTVSTQPAR